MDDRINDLERALASIEERNQRVEADKAWEQSLVRRAGISCMTYAIAVPTFVTIGSDRPFLDAFIPVIGYVLSTQSLPFAKKLWLKYRK